MANEVCTSLGLNGKDLSGKLVQIVEEHGSNASFMINSLMWNASRSDTSVCLLALHYSCNHYTLLAKKLGYNLKTAIDNKTAAVIEPFAMYVDKTKNFSEIDMSNEENLKRLFLDVRKALGSLPGKKCLMIDDLSDLMCLGSKVSSVVAFLQYCRDLQRSDPGLTLIVGSHCSELDENQQLLANFIAHVAQCRITVAALKTGFSANVTGSIDVVNNLGDENSTVTEHRLLHFKLTDRQVRVFAPGTTLFGISTST